MADLPYFRWDVLKRLIQDGFGKDWKNVGEFWDKVAGDDYNGKYLSSLVQGMTESGISQRQHKDLFKTLVKFVGLDGSELVAGSPQHYSGWRDRDSTSDNRVEAPLASMISATLLPDLPVPLRDALSRVDKLPQCLYDSEAAYLIPREARFLEARMVMLAALVVGTVAVPEAAEAALFRAWTHKLQSALGEELGCRPEYFRREPTALEIVRIEGALGAIFGRRWWLRERRYLGGVFTVDAVSGEVGEALGQLRSVVETELKHASWTLAQGG